MKRREFRIYNSDFEDTLNSVKSSSKINNLSIAREIEDIQQEV